MDLTQDVDNSRDNVAGTAAAATSDVITSRLRACRCGALFLPKRQQQSCSRRCGRRARPRLPAHRPVERNHLIVLRLLDIQPLERRARGGWRFGTKRIGDSLVARLIASGRAEIRGERLHATTERAT